MAREFEKMLSDIQKEIEDNKKLFRIENRVKDHIIVPILAKLSWEGHRVKVVQRERGTKNRGRVDLALCDNNGNPKVFIEVKRLGLGDNEKSKKQAWDYALAEKTRLIVLTDGRIWSFYLLAEEGSYEEQCFCKLNLLESSLQKSCDILHEYLDRNRVISEKAEKAAEGVIKARRTIPDAWTEILQRKKDYPLLKQLIEGLVAEVERRVGVEPYDNEVIDFLRSLQRQERQVPAPPSPREKDSKGKKRKSGRSGKLVILGKFHSCRNQNNATEIVFDELQKKDRKFLQRFYKHPKNQKNKYKGRRGDYRYLGQNYQELFGDNEGKPRSFVNIRGGWVVSADYNWEKKKKIIQLAAEVAGLEFGRDIIINFDD